MQIARTTKVFPITVPNVISPRIIDVIPDWVQPYLGSKWIDLLSDILVKKPSFSYSSYNGKIDEKYKNNSF